MSEENIKNSEDLKDSITENTEVEEVVTEVENESAISEATEDDAGNVSEDNATSEETVKKEEEEISEDTSKEETTEEAAASDGNASQSDFIDEFAPASIVIPNYNKEKELKKMERANLKKKKSNTKKNIKRRRLIKKIVGVVCAVLISLFLLISTTAMVSSVIVRVNTADFAIKGAIMDYGPERMIIGRIENPEELGMNKSHDSASVADVLRDNATISVTYSIIEDAVRESTYSQFISGVANDIVGYYVLGAPYKQVAQEEIANMLDKDSSKIKIVTGQELTDQENNIIAERIVKSKIYKEISEEELKKQEAAERTGLTSILFSLPVLIGFILAFMVAIVLVVMVCRGYAYKIIGWVLVLSGAISGIAGALVKPMYKASTEFVGCIVDAIVTSFHRNSLIYGAVVVAVGFLVLLAGGAIKDSEYDEEDDNYEGEYEDSDKEYENEEYIEEIEQVSTAN